MDFSLPPHLVDVAVPINDPPIALHELHGPFATIFDPDMIGPEPAALIRCRLFGQIADCNPNRQFAGNSDIGKKQRERIDGHD